ncbi:hypothetical protein N0V82_007593 [Gnomoniopsis sp. IMI 355080]|nr:hypothetical protein N0V82_007593 [Gnomoniopsis sp. IMI 355080]
MANFNDLAIELQLAIWKLVLPYRGVHWVEIEGRPHEPRYIHEALRFTHERCPDGNLPDNYVDLGRLKMAHEQWELSRDHKHYRWHYDRPTGLFFQYLVPVPPSVYGAAGPTEEEGAGDPPKWVAEELAYTRRCRELSIYTRVTTLLSTCSLSRSVACEYIQEYYPKYYPHDIDIYRSNGRLYRPRSLDVWEAQYADKHSEPEYGHHSDLLPGVRAPLDLVVLRLHDRHGRATPLLEEGLYQFSLDKWKQACILSGFLRVAIEWNPRWARPGPDGREQFRGGKVQAILDLIHSDNNNLLYWLVDGVPRPDWKRDYPSAVAFAFERWTARRTKSLLHNFIGMDSKTQDAFAADCDLDLEFEANGRRYYVVFVVINWIYWPRLPAEFMSRVDGPFPGGEDIFPEALRAPAKFAYDMMTDMSSNSHSMAKSRRASFILSWEPI